MTHLLLQTDNPLAGASSLILFVFAGLFIFILITVFIRRYKRCPSDRILVVYGKVGGGQSAKCIHGGAAFIMPVIQDYEFLDLTPISIEVNLVNALSKQNIRVNVPSRFTIGISTEPGVMQNAAERLLGLGQNEIQELAQEIIFGQLRLVVASMDIEEINNDRDKFLTNISESVETELKKVGLKLINVNITDIVDESGYIEALGKEAAAHAINAARKSVAEKTRDGSIGEANALQDERTQVAAANAKAVDGENTAKIEVANSDSLRRQREAEAERVAIASEKVQLRITRNFSKGFSISEVVKSNNSKDSLKSLKGLFSTKLSSFALPFWLSFTTGASIPSTFNQFICGTSSPKLEGNEFIILSVSCFDCSFVASTSLMIDDASTGCNLSSHLFK